VCEFVVQFRVCVSLWLVSFEKRNHPWRYNSFIHSFIHSCSSRFNAKRDFLFIPAHCSRAEHIFAAKVRSKALGERGKMGKAKLGVEKVKVVGVDLVVVIVV
jgi:hypothetical protein